MNLRQAFYDEIKAMYKTLRSTGALSYAKVEQMFEAHQNKWPEAIFNEDAWFKYLAPLVEKGNATYLSMLQGSKESQRQWWLYNRFKYLDSKYNAGDSLNDFIELRGYAKADITVTPYADIYASVKYGSYLVQTRAEHGQEYTLPCPLSNVNDTEIVIYSCSQLSSVGDLSPLKIGRANFSNATKIQSIKLGDGNASYTNGNLTELTLGNNALLRLLDVRNCPALTQAIDVSHCLNLEHVYAEGSSITGISLPNGGVLKTLHLPATVANLTIRNQRGITDFSIAGYDNLTTLRLENVSDVFSIFDILPLLGSGCRLRLTGFAWEFENTDEISDFYDILDGFRGLDENGGNTEKAQVSATIHIPSAKGNDLAELNSRYPYITINADHTEATLTYYNFDGSELLYTETIIDGGNGTKTNSTARESTAQYSFTPNGWSLRPDGQPNANALVGVMADRSVYAAYTASVRSYTVTWKNKNNALLETDQNVPYGTLPAFNGATPTYNNQTSIGWEPAVTAVTGNASYVAKYLPLYTVRFYNESTLLQTVSVEQGKTAVYTGNTPVSVDEATLPFLGWSRVAGSANPDANALKNIQADTDVYAIFEPFIVDEEITDSWEEIIASIDDGSYATKYQLGNYKPVDLGSDGTINMQIVAFDTDVDRNGVKIPLTFIAKEFLNGSYPLSATNGNGQTLATYNWSTTIARTKLNSTLYDTIPAVVKSRIISSKKTYAVAEGGVQANGTRITRTGYDKIWIPSGRELNLGSYNEDSGVIYNKMFRKPEYRIRYVNGSSITWPTRTSCWMNYDKRGMCVSSSGGLWPLSSNMQNNGKALIGFCLGYEPETITDSWDEIFAAEEDGTYSTKYSIGDTKALTVNNENHLMQIVAFDEGESKISWLSKNMLSEKHLSHVTNSMFTWPGMEIRAWLRNTVLPTIDADIRDHIVEVDKTYVYGTYAGRTTGTVKDTIWIPSARELGFSDYENSGVIYSEAFPDNQSRIKSALGLGIQPYQTRSSYSQTDSGCSLVVRETGIKGILYNGSTSYTCFGFCT